MAETKTWTGGCHCGAVRYQIEASLDGLMACNCSICQKRGSILTFVPVAQFKLLEGEAAQTDYQFNKKTIHHLFCKTCGVASFAMGLKPDGTPMVAVNVRSLNGIEADKLTFKVFDGKSL